MGTAALQILWIGNPSAELLFERRAEIAFSTPDALQKGADFAPDVIVIARDVIASGAMEGDLIENILREYGGALVLVWDPLASVADAVRYVRAGAHDVASSGSDLRAKVEAAVELRRRQREASASANAEPWRKFLIGSSRAMERTIGIIRLVSGRRSTVLITGETGTGKEMVARALHMASPRAHLPMVAVNCNALPENLIEAELFGHVKGAFTGAIQQRLGRFEQANRGTLFLDEIGDLALDMQTKLLRVLQEREFQRVGSSETIRLDVRLIAATNVNLAERVWQGKFREDLFYRLNVVPIAIPPLRKRPEDIPPLARHFVEKICRLEDIPAPSIAPEAFEHLQSYSWPGNVRQLENAVEMAIAMSGGRAILSAGDFTLPLDTLRLSPDGTPSRALAVPDAGLDFDQTTGSIERQILEDALRKTQGNKAAAARILGLKRTTLAAKLKSLGAAAGV
ncbi:MAG TPA: sigma-54 dependent transcriptional regulator [Bryobacteraceae bacterium]|nr:sigma-54 dependent transcriptional regulator [Bryobacteraceae bacterium]